MPIYQSIGIMIGAVATVLGLPRLADDVTNSARLEKKLDLIQRLADNAVLPGVKHVMTNKSAELSKRLASIYAIPNDRRVVFDLAMGIMWLVIGTVLVPQLIDDFDLPEFDGVRPIYWVVVYAGVWFTLHGLIRHRTVRLNRRLYMELGGPIDPPLLHAPPLRRLFTRGKSALTLGGVLKTAKDNWQSNPGVTLTEHVRAVINDLEQGSKFS
ncbi:hypothetical protein [Smaragdicoccus niigatensis]|uniref:hypothetical protein n=1 Tax=Smaragdicoccus niigatensis TaxID=359359 RepID=UPI000369077B|nr:hypothetical protein [Smaragdicoccus niigatensis]